MNNRCVFLSVCCVLNISAAMAQYGFEKKFGASGYEEGHSVIFTSDSNIAVFGHTTSTANGQSAGCILKISEEGDSLWMKSYDSELNTIIKYGIETTDNHFIMCGYSELDSINKDITIIKTDTSGNLIWLKTYGGMEEDIAYCIKEKDSTFVIAGKTKSYGNGGYDIFTFTINANGDSLRFNTYGTPADEIARHIEVTKDSGFIIAGSAWNATDSVDIYLLKLDALENLQWDKRFRQQKNNYGYSVQPTLDSGYILCGFHEDSTQFQIRDIFVIKTDSSGLEVWRSTSSFGSWSYEGTMLHSIKQTKTGEYIAVGTDHLQIVCRTNGSRGNDSQSNLFITKLDSIGNLIWSQSYNPWSGMQMGMDVAIMNDSTYIFCGFTEEHTKAWQPDNIYILKTNKQGSAWNNIREYNNNILKASLFPNPASSEVNITFDAAHAGNIEISVFDNKGRLVYSMNRIKITTGSNTLRLNIPFQQLSSGRYFLTMSDGESQQSLPLNILKTN